MPRFTWNDDPAQHDPFMVCEACDKTLCTIEEGDRLDVIVSVAHDHETDCEPDLAYMEDCVPAFVKLLRDCAETHGAPVFADDLARGGMNAENLRMMADRWRSGEFEPADFVGRLDLLADAVERTADLTP